MIRRPLDFPSGSDSKASAYNSGDQGSIPGWGRAPGKGNGNTLQYSCLENYMDEEVNITEHACIIVAAPV